MESRFSEKCFIKSLSRKTAYHILDLGEDEMIIHGLQKLTLLDYPGKTAATVFTGGCNFRCPFCHNAALVLDSANAEVIPEEEFFSFINKRKGLLDGVCVTGGEPLLNADIEQFLGKIHAQGFLVKLDTNGSFPDKLRRIIDAGLCDYVAMDIKTAIDEYDTAAGVHVDTNAIDESIDLLMKGNVDYEFRTTVVKGIHTAESFAKIGVRLRGAKRYFMQKFVDSGNLITPDFAAFSDAEMLNILAAVREYIPSADVRGL